MNSQESMRPGQNPDQRDKRGQQNALKFGVVIAYVVMLVCNALAATGVLGGIRTDQISDKYLNLFTPAGITFSIWGVIYLLLGAYVVFQLGFFQSQPTRAKSELYGRIGVLFIASAIFNSLWLVMWQFDLILTSTVLMIALLVTLIVINRILAREQLDTTEKVLLRLPFSIYFGWITVATIANFAVLLTSLNWDGFGIPAWVWTILVLIVGIIIAGAVMVTNNDVAYALAVVWGYAGIIIRHASSNGFAQAYPQIIVVAAACIVVLLMGAGYMIARNRMVANKKQVSQIG